MKRKKEGSYALTLKGLLSTILAEKIRDDVIDTIELYMRRNNYNAIVLEDILLFREVIKK